MELPKEYIMDVQQFLAQFHFASITDSMRFVLGNHVKIDGYTIKHDDLHKPISEFAKADSILCIGKKFRYKVREEHLPVPMKN